MFTCAEPEVPIEAAAMEPSSPAEPGPMKGAERRRFKADLQAIAAAADAGPEAASAAEEDSLLLSGKERRRQKASALLSMLAPLLSEHAASRQALVKKGSHCRTPGI